MELFLGDNSLSGKLCVAAAPSTVQTLTMPWWEWQDDRKHWTPFLPADRAAIERLYQRSSGQPEQTSDLSWNKGFNSMYCFDFRVMTQINLDSKKKRLLRRRDVPCCPKMHILERMGTARKPSSYSSDVICDVCNTNISQRKEAYHHCSACEYDRCLSCQGERLKLQSFGSLADWHRHFTTLSREQVDRLRQDVSVRAQLEREGLQVVWRQWLDTERTFGSDEGKTTTDLTLFAMGPKELRCPGFGHSDNDFVNFPAIRSPNYCDEVDVVGNTDGIQFDVKNRRGELVQGVTLRRFLAQLGEFIPDLEPSAAWTDSIDDTPLQTSSQFSIIPAPSGQADVGIAAFGHQCTNLHIVIGPAGDLGWAAERPGAQRIFFRDTTGRTNHAISLVPEKREEVSNAFFKLEARDETVEEEKQRYEKVQNRLIHLQVTMDGVAQAPTGAQSQSGRGNVCPNGHNLAVFLTPHDGYLCDMCGRTLPTSSKMFGCRPCDFDHCTDCWRKCAPKGTPEPSAPPPQGKGAGKGLGDQGALSDPPFHATNPGWAALAKSAHHALAAVPSASAGGPVGAAPRSGAFQAAPGLGLGPVPQLSASASAISWGGMGCSPMSKGLHGSGGATYSVGSTSLADYAAPALAASTELLGGMGAVAETAMKVKEKAAKRGRFDEVCLGARSRGRERDDLRDHDDDTWRCKRSEALETRASKFGYPAGAASKSGSSKKKSTQGMLCMVDLLDGEGSSSGGSLDPRSAAEEGPGADGASIESGLLLAVVERGAEVGPAAEHQRVPTGARRKPGVAVRVTYLFYGLAADGRISAERTRRFARQADFRRRELGLPHGSLVSGLGSWGGPENAPIKLFGFRLTDAMDGRRSLETIEGVSQVPMPVSLRVACQSLSGVVPGVLGAADHAERAAKALMSRSVSATQQQVAALYLYTMEHNFYRQLNAAMRDEDRSKAKSFFCYLKLLFSGLQTLAVSSVQKPRELWRGVHKDLSLDHQLGSEVTWWGASSCTPKLTVAQGFLGRSGARTLFRVQHQSAVSIKDYSAFRGEEEWLLAPGTRLRVERVVPRGGGLSEITLLELPPPRDIR
uniref:NAD(P)(+)--arginine ADP-ribosyltransferase n=1 Tax=Pyrodinium bahamense TaxID=73915 RepID=A0A7R9ZVS8_9DINO